MFDKQYFLKILKIYHCCQFYFKKEILLIIHGIDEYSSRFSFLLALCFRNIFLYPTCKCISIKHWFVWGIYFTILIYLWCVQKFHFLSIPSVLYNILKIHLNKKMHIFLKRKPSNTSAEKKQNNSEYSLNKNLYYIYWVKSFHIYL